MEIDRAVPADAVEMGFIQASIWQIAYADMVADAHLAKITAKKRAAYFKEAVNVAYFPIFVCRENHRIIGIIELGKARDAGIPGFVGEIGGFYFIPEYWGRDETGEAMDFAKAWLWTEGHAYCYLWVLEGNYRARQFYEKHGFRMDGEQREINLGKKMKEVRYWLDLITGS